MRASQTVSRHFVGVLVPSLHTSLSAKPLVFDLWWYVISLYTCVELYSLPEKSGIKKIDNLFVDPSGAHIIVWYAAVL